MPCRTKLFVVVSAISTILAPQLRAQQDVRSEILRLAILHTLPPPTNCTFACDSIAVVLSTEEQALLPDSFPLHLVRISAAQADSVNRVMRIVVLRELSVYDNSAVVKLDYLFRPGTTGSSPFAPASRGTMPPAEGGWSVLLRKSTTGWFVTSVQGWIT